MFTFPSISLLKGETMTSVESQLTASLKSLVETCRDGANRYRGYTKYLKAEGVRKLWQGYGDQHNQYADELQNTLERLGGHSHSSGTIAEAIHQGWTRVKSAFTGGDDRALLAECEQAEGATVQQYTEALDRKSVV